MQDTLLHLQIYYEIAMAIGESVELKPMLSQAVGVYLKKLNCNAAVIFGREKEVIFSIPRKRTLEKNDAFQAALQNMPQQTTSFIVSSYKTSSIHWFSLPNFGFLLLTKQGNQITDTVCQSLLPINQKLTKAIFTCLQNQKMKEVMQEVAEKNSMLIASEEELRLNFEQVSILQKRSEEAYKKTEEILKRLTDSINYAQRIQNAIIPQEQEIQKYFDCFVFFRPKNIVSGDFYWFADKGDKQILVVGDCTGHGVSGAFMTLIANNLLTQIIHDYEIHQPAQILNLMPILLEKTLHNAQGKVRDGMDISIITIQKETATTRVSYAGAKRPLYYIEDKEFKTIKGNRVSIMSKLETEEQYHYKEHHLEFGKKQSIQFFLCSDGYQDQFGGEKNRKFLTKNFRKLLFQTSSQLLSEQKYTLIKTFDDWKKDMSQTDDVLVLSIKID